MYVLSEAKLYVGLSCAVSFQHFIKTFEVNAPQLMNRNTASSTCMGLCILRTLLTLTQYTVCVWRGYWFSWSVKWFSDTDTIDKGRLWMVLSNSQVDHDPISNLKNKMNKVSKVLINIQSKDYEDLGDFFIVSSLSRRQAESWVRVLHRENFLRLKKKWCLKSIEKSIREWNDVYHRGLVVDWDKNWNKGSLTLVLSSIYFC